MHSTSVHSLTVPTWRVIILVASCALTLLNGCSSKKGMRERALRDDLTSMRTAVDQYVQEHGEHPRSFQDLIRDRYMREVPVDPMTGRSDTWILKFGTDPRNPKEPLGILEIHSGSTDLGSDGRPYSAW